jgi:hypothetical protein
MIRGNTLHLFKHSLLALALSGIVFSVGVLGPAWPQVLTLSAALAVPLLILSMPLVRWMNRFGFDDERAEIVKPGGKRIPCGRITGVLLLDRVDSVDVLVRQGRLHTTALVRSADAGEQVRILEELLRRVPGASVVTKRRPWQVMVIAVPALLAVAAAGAHGFLYHRHPSLTPSPRVISAAAGNAQERAKPQPRSGIGDFRFTLPAGYVFIGEGDGSLSFEERSQNLRLEIIAKIRRPGMAQHAFWFRYGMGVRSFADLTALYLRARYGVVPLFLRALALTGQEDVVLYETAPPLLRGYVTQGRRGREELTHVFLSGEGPEQEIHLYLTGPARVPEEALRAIITGIRQDRRPTADR